MRHVRHRAGAVPCGRIGKQPFLLVSYDILEVPLQFLHIIRPVHLVAEHAVVITQAACLVHIVRLPFKETGIVLFRLFQPFAYPFFRAGNFPVQRLPELFNIPIVLSHALHF